MSFPRQCACSDSFPAFAAFRASDWAGSRLMDRDDGQYRPWKSSEFYVDEKAEEAEELSGKFRGEGHLKTNNGYSINNAAAKHAGLLLGSLDG